MIASQFILFDPDWQGGVKFRYTWQTAIKRGIQGNERRSKLKSWPERSISWESQLNTNYFRNLFLRKLFFNFENVFGIPIWQNSSSLTSSAAIGATTIYCDTANRDFFAGGLILITNDFQVYEYAEIDSFNSNSITLTDNLVNNYIAGSQVFPILQGRISNTNYINIAQATGKHSSVNFDFTEAYEETQIYQVGVNDFPTYNGFSVLNMEPNWDTKIEFGISKSFEVLKSIGIETSYCYQSQADFTMILRYAFSNSEDCKRFETFFNDMAGRFNSFWIPTWGNDFVITSGIASSDTTLTIESINYSTNWLLNDLIGRTIFIKSFDETEIYRKIIAAPNATTIILDSAIGIDVDAEELRSIVSCFLLPVRFDQDEIEMNYQTNTFAEVEIKVISLNDSDMIPT